MEADGGNERQLEGKWQCELSAKAVEGQGGGGRAGVGEQRRKSEERRRRKKCGGARGT